MSPTTVFFNLLMVTRVVSIPNQIQTDFVKLATLFQGTLTTAAGRHKCNGTLTHAPKKIAVSFW
jgi:hypothetical protein